MKKLILSFIAIFLITFSALSFAEEVTYQSEIGVSNFDTKHISVNVIGEKPIRIRVYIETTLSDSARQNMGKEAKELGATKILAQSEYIPSLKKVGTVSSGLINAEGDLVKSNFPDSISYRIIQPNSPDEFVLLELLDIIDRNGINTFKRF